MRFKKFLQEDSTSNTVKTAMLSTDKEGIEKWVREHAAKVVQNLSTKNMLMRGVKTGLEFATGDSTTFTRKAAYTKNFINLFIQDSPRWSKFPSRSSAFICANSFYGAEKYSSSDDPFLVIPADNAKIGFCPEMDFWISFERGINKAGLPHEYFEDIGAFNARIDDIGHMLKIKFSETDAEELHDQLRDVTPEALMKARHTTWKLDLINAMHKLEVTNLGDLMEIILGPELNKFQHFPSTSMTAKNDRHEMWVEGKCAFIKVNRATIDSTIEWLKAIK